MTSRWPHLSIAVAAVLITGLPLVLLTQSPWVGVVFVPVVTAVAAVTWWSRWIGGCAALVGLGILVLLPGTATLPMWTFVLIGVPVFAVWLAGLLLGSRVPLLVLVPPLIVLAVSSAVSSLPNEQRAVVAGVVGALSALQLLIFELRRGATSASWSGRILNPVIVVVVGVVAGALTLGVSVVGGGSRFQADIEYREQPTPDTITIDVADPLQRATEWQLGLLDPGVLLAELLPPVQRFIRPIWVSLQEYDGEQWRVQREYTTLPDGRTQIALDPLAAASKLAPVSVRIRVAAGLPGRWVPTPQPVLVLVGQPVPMVYDPATGVLAALTSPVGQSFVLGYGAPVASTEELQNAGPALSTGVDPALALPGTLPPAMADLAARVEQEAGPNYFNRLTVLARELRQAGRPAPATLLSTVGTVPRDYDALDRVLRDGVGFQEQYAAIWALIARSWGVPTQLSIGFLPKIRPLGTAVEPADVSIWASARLAGLGWVQFQPSPQDALAGRPGIIRPFDPDKPLPGPRPNPTPTPTPTPEPTPQPEPDVVDGDRIATVLAPALAVVLLIWLGCVRVVRERRRRPRGTPRQRIVAAWGWTRSLLDEADHPIGRARPLDASLADVLPESLAPLVVHIAEEVSPALYAPGEPDEDDARRVWGYVRVLEKTLTRPAVLVKRAVLLPTRQHVPRRSIPPASHPGAATEERLPELIHR